uniref:N-acetyltransferase domain-containing protein n=1 Tax=Rhabditophanes sp. KR3021 TaxID=114890 RepID=A0AC35U4E1_9BILA
MADIGIVSFAGLPDVSINYNTLGKNVFDHYAIVIKNSLGWVCGLQYSNVLYKSFDEEDIVFITASEKETEKPMGCIMGTFWKNTVGKKVLLTIGAYFILPEHRGKGLGDHLFNALYKKGLEQNVILYLCSFPKMSQQYAERYSFNLFRDFNLATYSPKCSDFVNKKEISLPTHNVFDHKNFTEWEKLQEFDLRLTNGVVDRMRYIKNLFESSIYSGIVMNDKNDVVGYISVQECADRMLFVGPLYAENKEIVQLLINKVLENIDISQFSEMRLKAFTCNADLKDILMDYTNGKINYLGSGTLQFSIASIPTDIKYVHCIVDTTQNFI